MKSRSKIIAMILAASLAASVCSCDSATTGTDAALEETGSSVAEDAASASETSSEEATETTETKTFETMYGSQVNGFLNHQFYFDGEEVPVAESNFYFINDFLDLTQYAQYGYYPSTSEGYLDLSAELEDGSYDESVAGHCDTWGDFFISFAQKDLEGVCIMNELAEEQGLELTDETLENIETLMTNLTTSAEDQGLTLDEYLELYYGPDCDEEMFRYILNRYYIADLYTSNYVDNYEFDEDDIVMVPTVRYALFSAPETSTDADGNTVTISDEDLSAAETAANDLLASCETVDDLETQGTELQNSGEVTQYGEVQVVKDQFVSDFEDWAWDESRTDGELGVIYAPEYGYFVVGFVGMEEDEDSMDDIAYNAFSEEMADIIASDEYSLTTDDEFPVAEPVASDETAAADTAASDTAEGETASSTDAITAGTAESDSSAKKRAGIAVGVVAGVAVIGFAGALAVDKKKKKATAADSEEKKEDNE